MPLTEDTTKYDWMTYVSRQSGKSQMMDEYIKQYIKSFEIAKLYGSRIGTVILDKLPVYKNIVFNPMQNKSKDWECNIPNPDPFARPMSSPSGKVRAKARAKRKKK